MKQRVGFSNYSLKEIEHLWRDISLFYFMETSPHEMVQAAEMWFAPDSKEGKRIRKQLNDVFSSRCQVNKYGNLVIDDNLSVDIRETGNPYFITVSPTKLEAWSEAHFNLMREIDAALRPIGIQTIEKPHRWLAFFQGKVVE